HPRLPGKGRRFRANDRSAACRGGDPRWGVAGARHADARASAEARDVSGMPDPLRKISEDLANDRRTPRAATSLRRRHSALASTAEQLRILDAVAIERQGKPVEFETLTADKLRPGTLEIFQINVGKLCNMTCRHCHVDAGPDRTDAVMSDAVVDQVIRVM